MNKKYFTCIKKNGFYHVIVTDLFGSVTHEYKVLTHLEVLTLKKRILGCL